MPFSVNFIRVNLISLLALYIAYPFILTNFFGRQDLIVLEDDKTTLSFYVGKKGMPMALLYSANCQMALIKRLEVLFGVPTNVFLFTLGTFKRFHVPI